MKKLLLVLLLILTVVGPIIVTGNPVNAATGGYGTVNLAKGKTVTPLTNTIRGKPEDVNDGNVDSVWYSFNSNYGGNSNANSFVLDMGSAYSIGKIDILLAQAYGFTINTSNDNSTWTERYKSPWAATSVNASISVTPDGAFSARYIKYWGYANWAQYVGVMEINVYEWLASPPPPLTGANGSTNLALNKSVTNLLGSVVQSNPPAYAVDGNPATSWASSQSSLDGNGKSQNSGQIRIDLGAKYRIGKVVISPQRVHGFRIVMAETDPAPAGSPWFFMSYPELFGATKTSGDPYTFSLNGSVTARYIWLTTDIWGTPGSLQTAIAEIEVYEWGTSSTTSATIPSPASAQAGLMGYWSFNEGNGTIAKDSSGNGNDGTISGATWATGKFGNALNFDGNADSVKLPNTAINGLTDITFTAWIKTDANKSTGIITGNKSGMDNEFLLFIDGGYLSPYVKNQSFLAKKKITDGLWHFIAVGRTGNTGEVLVYVDGQLDTRNMLPAGKLVIDPNGLWIGREQDCVGGCWDTNQDFQGYLDEVAIYNRVLSQAEIQAAMGTGAAGPPTSTPPPAATSTPTPAVITTPTPAARPTDTLLLAEERTVSTNGKTTIPIRLDKADRLGSLNFSLRYDPVVLKVNKAESGDLAGGTLFQANIQDAGIIRFGVIAQGTAGITGDGPVAHVEFVALGARGKQSQLTLGDLMATDTSGARLGVTLRAGRVTIETKMKGDYDGDGKVTAKDSLAALKMSVGALPEDLNLDMDGDGKVTAEDGRRILAGALGNPVIAVSQPAQPTTASTPAPGGQTPAALPPLVTKTLEPSSSPQLVSYKNEVGLIIPGGTLQSRQTVTISPAPNLPAHPFNGFTELAAYDISMGSVREFKEPLTIEIAYDPAKLPPNVSPDKALSVGWWDTDQKVWVSSPFVVDTARNVIMIPTTHLTAWKAWALATGWTWLEKKGEHFIVFYDLNTYVAIGSKKSSSGAQQIPERIEKIEVFAEQVNGILKEAYDKYDMAHFDMSLSYVGAKNTGTVGGVVGTAITRVALVGGLAAKITASTFAATPVGVVVGGALLGRSATRLVVGEKTSVWLNNKEVIASWNAYTGDISVPLNFDNDEHLRHELRHELFHAVQNGYFSNLGMKSRRWWIEATADYAASVYSGSGPDRLSKVAPDYFSFPITTAPVVDLGQPPVPGQNHEYMTARFIEYLVKKGANFKEMWDFVACADCLTTGRFDAVQALEEYVLTKTKTSLHDHYRDFAAYVLFDASGPLEKLETNLFDSAIPVGPPALPATEDEASNLFILRENYSAKLWGIRVDPKPSQTERSLIVIRDTRAENVSLGVYVLPNDQRVPGGVKGAIIGPGSQSTNVTVKKGEVLYILAVNTGRTDQTLTVKVRDAATPAAVAVEGLIKNPRNTFIGTPDNPVGVRLSGSIKGDAGLRFEGAEFYSEYAKYSDVLAFVYSIPANATSSSLDFDGLVIEGIDPAKKSLKVPGTTSVLVVSNTQTLTLDFTYTYKGWSGIEWTGGPMKNGYQRMLGNNSGWTAGKPLSCKDCVMLDPNRNGEGTPFGQPGAVFFIIDYHYEGVAQYRDMKTGVTLPPQKGDTGLSQKVVIRLVKRG